jgi:hypothetical protein
MNTVLETVLSEFGSKAKAKLTNLAASGQPEDQIRAPFEQLLGELAQLCQFSPSSVVAVGESSVSDLKTRPDYAVSVDNALVGFIELKAPGKGADPRKFGDVHDKAQWEKLRSLPNLMYTDGNSFSVWQNGEIAGPVLHLIGDIETSGTKIQAPPGFLLLFENFLKWEPAPPRSTKELARSTALLCRLLRDEVTEQLSLQTPALTELATDWRKLLFPEATNEKFADGYAQAVTFGMLLARAKNIKLSAGLQEVATTLSKTSSLIGAALRLLTDNAENQRILKTALGTLTRVLDAVDWSKISKGDPDAWLYFYEEFLEIYDNRLRKLTGSYYTPPEVVSAMVNIVDQVLRSPRFGQAAGLAAPAVTVADPATGTGTFLLGVLRKIATTVKEDEGEGSVSGAINAAVKRLIGFEIQLGPFAVAQLRILAEIVELTGGSPKSPARLYVTNTLGNPHDDEGWIPGILAPLANSRKEANKIKRDEPITVVIGNPPYKEKAKGQGAWIESGSIQEKTPPAFAAWLPPRGWGVGAHAKHLRNLYVYFWRWATWKIYDQKPTNNTGIVCFITVAGFLNGPGFQKMRDYLRRTCDDIWVIDCSPEGHQPDVNTRIFQGVQQPVCVVLASRSSQTDVNIPAEVKFIALPAGHRQQKFEALNTVDTIHGTWIACPKEWRDPFLPASTGAWAAFPKLEDLFVYNGSGVMPGRTWVIAPDVESLERRWNKLIHASKNEKETLFHPHLRKGKPGDKHTKREVPKSLAYHKHPANTIENEKAHCLTPVRYGFRTLDRQWIIPDARVINQPNPEIWAMYSEHQVYLTALSRTSPTKGPAITFTGCIPDLDHYKGSFGGRVFPMWRDEAGAIANVPAMLLLFLKEKYGSEITGDAIVAYIAAVASHSGYISRFRTDLSTPGLRIPITASGETFREAVEIGRKVIWLQTFGERMVDISNGRPAQPPRLTLANMPRIPADGKISQDVGAMPDNISFDLTKRRLIVGTGYVENVDEKVWNYEVSGKQILVQWFSYRKANRERPIIGDRRAPSVLGDIKPDYWLAEYTTELINLLNVWGLLVGLEEVQAKLLEKICTGPLISSNDFREAGVSLSTEQPEKMKKKAPLELFD